MAQAKYLTRWEDVPHEPGERFKFRMPNWVIIEEARQERQRKANQIARETRETLGQDVLKQIREEVRQARAEAEAQADAETTALATIPTAEERLNEFDQLLLLSAGIEAWTYCEPQLDADGNPLFDADGRLVKDPSKPIPVNTETVADLDEPTRKWAGLTLIALVDSGFRPIMPEVEQRGSVIDVRPGTDPHPFVTSYSSDGTLTAATA